jgi:hypothetical protein
MEMTMDQKIKTHRWRAATNWYGTVNGKLVGTGKTKSEVEAAIDSEVMRIKRQRFDDAINRSENND